MTNGFDSSVSWFMNEWITIVSCLNSIGRNREDAWLEKNWPNSWWPLKNFKNKPVRAWRQSVKYASQSGHSDSDALNGTSRETLNAELQVIHMFFLCPQSAPKEMRSFLARNNIADWLKISGECGSQTFSGCMVALFAIERIPRGSKKGTSNPANWNDDVYNIVAGLEPEFPVLWREGHLDLLTIEPILQ